MSRESSHAADKAKKKSGMARWLSQFKSWVAVSEPSGQAFEQHRKDMFKSNGVAPHDPQASAKMQYVIPMTPARVLQGVCSRDRREVCLCSLLTCYLVFLQQQYRRRQ